MSIGFRVTYTVVMEQPKNKGGRPPKPDDERLVQRSIRLPPELWAKIAANGGIDWLRAVIKRAKAPVKK